MLINQGHESAAVVEPVCVTFPRADGPRTPPQLLVAAVRDCRPQHIGELT
jgi:hypothetical protein